MSSIPSARCRLLEFNFALTDRPMQKLALFHAGFHSLTEISHIFQSDSETPERGLKGGEIQNNNCSWGEYNDIPELLWRSKQQKDLTRNEMERKLLIKPN